VSGRAIQFASLKARENAMSDKIKPQHLSRKAILYVRQPSPYQVTNNLESQKLQYAIGGLRNANIFWNPASRGDLHCPVDAVGSCDREN
jgi:hypothetical protein